MPRNNLAVLVLAHVKKNKNTHIHKKGKKKNPRKTVLHKILQKRRRENCVHKIVQKNKTKKCTKIAHRNEDTKKIVPIHMDASLGRKQTRTSEHYTYSSVKIGTRNQQVREIHIETRQLIQEVHQKSQKSFRTDLTKSEKLSRNISRLREELL